MENYSTSPGRRKAIRALGFLAAAFSAIAIIPAGLMAIMSVFLFDAPGSGTNLLTWGLAIGLMVAPFALFVSAKKGVEVIRTGRTSDLYPALAFPVAIAIWLAGMWWLLETFCGGNLGCN